MRVQFTIHYAIKTFALHIYLTFILGPHFVPAALLLGLYATIVHLQLPVIFRFPSELHTQSIRGALLPITKVALCSL